jgi:hypothetical protein
VEVSVVSAVHACQQRMTINHQCMATVVKKNASVHESWS